jgi:hypothetical protein
MSDLRTAAQQALEALKDCVKALDALHAPGDSIYTRASDSADRAEIALRDALAQQEQEPVAWASWRELARIKDFDANIYANGYFDNAVPLYTHPPRREWQGLTEEDMEDLLPLYSDPNTDAEMLEFASAVEAKLKEKNNG